MGPNFVQNTQMALIKHIIAALQPTGLKFRIEDVLWQDSSHLKGDASGFRASAITEKIHNYLGKSKNETLS